MLKIGDVKTDCFTGIARKFKLAVFFLKVVFWLIPVATS
ncbi:hypothetical protein PI23P_09880 [Polaribacter irgensii 23-P]|uniref:Uncharacterized protein n=1 Tax=Polaribacter irgensii 23-P TaxID=313594 RepID=A4C0I5_9FLAO|nr:hypothetical protein PI23P_09880 [Polaribacter irgensii 23-P]